MIGAFLPISVHAQRGIPRTGNVSVSSTVVRKTQTQRSIRKFDARIGYQHIVEVNFSGFQNAGADYIGGWRFNNWLFLGGGIGFRSEMFRADPNIKNHIGGDICLILETYSSLLRDIDAHQIYDELGVSGNDREIACEAINSYAVPLYAYVRTYLSRTMAAPYLSLSVGGRLASKDYGPYLDLSGGVDFRINDRYHMFLSCGFWLSSYRQSYLEDFRYFGGPSDLYNYQFDIRRYWDYGECEENCHYSGKQDGHVHIVFSNLFRHKSTALGFSIKLGLSF